MYTRPHKKSAWYQANLRRIFITGLFCFLALLFTSQTQAAYVTTIVPNAVRSLPSPAVDWGITWRGATCSHTDVDEDIDSPNDTDECVSSGLGSSLMYFDLSNASVSTITSIVIRVRHNDYPYDGIPQASIYYSNGSLIGTCTPPNTPTNAYITDGCAINGLSLNSTDVAGLYLKLEDSESNGGNPATYVSALNVELFDAPYTTPNMSLVSPADGYNTFSGPVTPVAKYNNTQPGTVLFQRCSTPSCSTILNSYTSASGITNGTNVSYGTGFNTANSYYWRVSGRDDLYNVSGNWTSVFLFNIQGAPATPYMSAPTDASVITDTTPTLRARFDDPNKTDTGTVHFQLCADSACGTILQSGSSPSGISYLNYGTWDVPSALTPGTTYYWRAQNEDQYGQTSSWASTYSFTINISPTIPVHITPANTTSTSDLTPDLTARFSDPNASDTGTLTFELCTVVTSVGQSCISAGGVVKASGATSSGIVNGANATWTPASDIPAGTYYWHVYATDSAGTNSSWSATYTLILNATISISTDAPSYSLGILNAGVDATTTGTITIDSNNPSGYILNAEDDSNTYASSCALPCTGGINDWTAKAPSLPSQWLAGVSGYEGITVISASTPGNRLGKWGSASPPLSCK